MILRDTLTHGNPTDRAGVQMMDEDNPAKERRISDVHMETLDLGGDDDDIQQTQASQAERAAEDIETEAPAAEAVTNMRSSIAKEEDAILPSAGAPPANDEIIRL